MSDQTAEQIVSVERSGWHYLPEVFLGGLAGVAVWFAVARSLEPRWLCAAVCTALPASAAAVLLAGPRRPLDVLGAFGIAAVATAGLTLGGTDSSPALVALFVDFFLVGLAIGAVLGGPFARLAMLDEGPGSRWRWRLVGGLIGGAGMPLCLLWLVGSPDRPPFVDPLSTLLLEAGWLAAPSIWLATILMVAFLEHRKRAGVGAS